MTSNFATLLRRKKTTPSQPGTLIYKWSYINSKNELVEEEKDLDAMIQSYADSVNYKEIIEQYGMDNEFLGQSNNAIYADVTDLDEMDYADVNKYISGLVKDLNNALALKEQKAPRETVEQSNAPAEKGAKVDSEDAKQGGKEK